VSGPGATPASRGHPSSQPPGVTMSGFLACPSRKTLPAMASGAVTRVSKHSTLPLTTSL
jgi:hypothetical protein